MKPCKKREETQLNALINEYEVNEDSENVARVKAENALLPVYRKELSVVTNPPPSPSPRVYV